jgi:hypothetical protein
VVQLAANLLLNAFAYRHYGYNRSDADDYTHHRPKAAQLGAAQRVNAGLKMAFG